MHVKNLAIYTSTSSSSSSNVSDVRLDKKVPVDNNTVCSDSSRMKSVVSIRALLPDDLVLKQCIESFTSYVNSVLCRVTGPLAARITVDSVLSRCMVLDYVPMLARMVQYEMNDDSYRALGIDSNVSGRNSGSRRSTRGNSGMAVRRLNYMSNATQLTPSELEKLLEYGFVGARILNGEVVTSGRMVLCLNRPAWSM